eukprot:1161410-Pelagomonas_calceolata.AAC.12
MSSASTCLCLSRWQGLWRTFSGLRLQSAYKSVNVVCINVFLYQVGKAAGMRDKGRGRKL